MKWAASTAVALNTSVPWVMCSQEDAPDPIVSQNQLHTCFIIAALLCIICTLTLTYTML